ncbi:extracellular solute-binding protein [Vallitalea okinawensis]|uniref:extracellular solute-binding protein n=1 Tax=Vallitalea okinawensis TaxID=2078660 RepID=UPI000CFB7D05|nr:extracellular solute-binding protein [Vallitalea okinawensis]
MLKKSKVVIQLIVVLMMIFVLAGCSENSDNEDTSSKSDATPSEKAESNEADSELEHATLRFIFFGDKRSETDTVWDAIAKEYKEELNCDIETTFIAGSDYVQKMNTLAASGDDWDMNFDGDWLGYSQMVNNGAYMDLTDLLPVYAPTLYDTYMEQGTLGAATSNGQIVALPWTMSMNQRPYFYWRSDLEDAAGLDIPVDEVSTVEEMDEALFELKEAYPEKYIKERAFIKTFLAKYELAEVGFQNYVFDLNDPECKVIPVEQTEAYKEMAEYAKRWQDGGIIRKDVLIDDLDANTLIRQGMMITKTTWHEWAYADDPIEEEGAEIEVSLLYPENKYADRTPLANVVAINANSANPERTLMFLELLETDQKLYDMVQYGIEGLTYELDNGRAVYPGDMTRSSTNYMEWGGQWGLWKPQFFRANPSYSEGFWVREAEFAALEQNVSSPLNGFFPNTENIDKEIAGRSRVWDEYNKVIEVGLGPDADSFVEEFITESKEAGTNVITEELQRQVDEFLANK